MTTELLLAQPVEYRRWAQDAGARAVVLGEKLTGRWPEDLETVRAILDLNGEVCTQYALANMPVIEELARCGHRQLVEEQDAHLERAVRYREAVAAWDGRDPWVLGEYFDLLVHGMWAVSALFVAIYAVREMPRPQVRIDAHVQSTRQLEMGAQLARGGYSPAVGRMMLATLAWGIPMSADMVTRAARLAPPTSR